jgi:hypothetical protein
MDASFTVALKEIPLQLKELHERYDDSLHVQLLWDPNRNEIWLRLRDERGEIPNECIPVPNDEAMDAFWHPFTYINA